MEITAEVLAGGKASRLYRSLVVEKKLAADVSAEADDNALGTLFTVEAFASNGVPTTKLEAALATEVGNIAKVPPTEEELRRAKSRILLGATRELQALNGHGGESGRLGQLQRFNHYLGDPSAISKWYQRIWAVRASDVSAVCAQWLVDEHRVSIVTQAKEQGQKP
jgi:zinc protease